MPQKTNLNISPYYDDFSKDNQFYRVLFNPGRPVQARVNYQLYNQYYKIRLNHLVVICLKRDQWLSPETQVMTMNIIQLS